jgi:integrase
MTTDTAEPLRAAALAALETARQERRTARRDTKPVFRVQKYKAAARPHLKARVRWRDDAGKWQEKFFATIKEAETYAQQRNTELLNQGREVLGFPTWLRVMAQRCDAALSPFGKTIEDATQYFLAALKARSVSRDLCSVMAEFLALKKTQGVSKPYIIMLRSQLGDFTAAHPGKLVCDITVPDCNAFLAAQDVSARSRNHRRVNLVTFFNFAKDAGYCESNPAQKSPRTKVVDKPIGILTPDALARLLEAACPHTLPYIAIGAFAGVRSAELQRLDWSEVDLEEGFIEIRAAKSKTATRRLIKIQPCLRAWLEPIAKARGPVVTSQTTLWSLLAATRERAGMEEWPHNALRHSFASYHLAHFKDAPALALEMGHAGCNMIFAHYRQIVRPAEALRYWNITPAEPGKVLELAIENQKVSPVTQPRQKVPGGGAPFVSAMPWRRAYPKTMRDYAKQYGVGRMTIQKWMDLGRPLDDPEAMRKLRKQRYARPLGEYCARYGKRLNTIKIWAKAGWPLDDAEAMKHYMAARKLTARRPKATNKALRLLTLPEPARQIAPSGTAQAG